MTAPFIASTREITGIVSDGRYLYWSRWAGNIWRANLDGSDAEQLIVTPSGTGSLATDGTYFYWSVPNEPRISRARVDGSDVEADFVLLEDGAWPAGVTTDGSYVYWTDNGLSRIGRIEPTAAAGRTSSSRTSATRTASRSRAATSTGPTATAPTTGSGG